MHRLVSENRGQNREGARRSKSPHGGCRNNFGHDATRDKLNRVHRAQTTSLVGNPRTLRGRRSMSAETSQADRRHTAGGNMADTQANVSPAAEEFNRPVVVRLHRGRNLRKDYLRKAVQWVDVFFVFIALEAGQQAPSRER